MTTETETFETARSEFFRTKRDDGVSQADLVYEAIRQFTFDDVISYELLEEATGINIRENRGPLYEAIRRLEKNDLKTAENVPKVGYRIVKPSEHSRLALKHHKKSRRQLRKAQHKVASADRTKLTATEAQRLQDLQVVVSRHEQLLGRITKQMNNMDSAIKESRQEQQEKHGELSEQVARLKAALERRGLLDD